MPTRSSFANYLQKLPNALDAQEARAPPEMQHGDDREIASAEARMGMRQQTERGG
jgi:hypothetical protein